MTDRPTYRLIIRAGPTGYGMAPPAVRLRQLLKRLLRIGGWRCLDLAELPVDDSQAASAADRQPGAKLAQAEAVPGHTEEDFPTGPGLVPF